MGQAVFGKDEIKIRPTSVREDIAFFQNIEMIASGCRNLERTKRFARYQGVKLLAVHERLRPSLLLFGELFLETIKTSGHKMLKLSNDV
jgi:hypothetical protein